MTSEAAVLAAEPEEDFGKLRIPEQIKKFLITMPAKAGQPAKKYLPAAWRLLWFRDEHPDWSVDTKLVHLDLEAGMVVAKATVSDETGRVRGTGHCLETKVGFPAGWIEKAETTAIARALGFCGFAPNADESILADTDPTVKQADSGVAVSTGIPKAGTVNDGPERCTSCGAPVGKKHLPRCGQ